ncbi:MAG: amidase [Sulfitobacter sp.]
MPLNDTFAFSDLDLCYMSARDQIALFKSGKLSPVDVLKAQLARAEAVEPKINAFTDMYPDAAMSAARAAEDVYTKRPDEARPLEGITVAIKDEMSVKGQRNTQGSLIYKDYIADDTHPVAERLQAAGAIFHARSTTPEFCCAWVTDTRLHGTSRNPWGLEYTTSGSSGGAAAALAAGTTTLSTGSDIGGSIRGPAGACGIVGFKPPYGRVPDAPPFNLDSYCHVGAMARTTGDCALMQNVISGFHPQDIATVREEMAIPFDYGSLKGKRIAYTFDVSNKVVTDDVTRQTHAVLDALSDAGAIVEEVHLGWGREVRDSCKNYLNHLMGAALVREVEAHPDLVCDYTTHFAALAKQTTADDFLAAFDVAADIYSRFGPMMENDYYAFICPTFASYDMYAQQKPWDRIAIGDRDFDSDYDLNTQAVFNMLSRLPVLAVPAGIGSNGRPVSVQIVARAFDDPRVFHVARVLEQSMPWLDNEARRPVL